MSPATHADITPLLDAVSAADEARVIEKTLDLLGPGQVPPAHIAARVAIPAAWAGGDGHPLLVLGAAGRVAEWMRSIPAGPEPGAAEEAKLRPALPLVQGFLAVAASVRAGLPEPHPDLPAPTTPIEIKAPGGARGALREALAAGDRQRFASVLMGFYRTGTDYRELLANLYAVLVQRHPVGGHPLIFTSGSSRVLDMAEWGIRVPPLIHWIVPLALTTEPDEPWVAQVRAYAAAPDHQLDWLRDRLAVAKEDAAGPAMRQAVLSGDTAAACDAVFAALRGGASQRGVASGLALAAAERLLTFPNGDADALLRAGHVLLYTHAVHQAMRQTQDPDVFPLLYTAAGAVNALRGPATAVPTPASTPLAGGLIASAQLRAFGQQIEQGNAATALATAKRYIQMGHAPRSLAGMLGAAASRHDPRGAGLHTLPIAAAAAEEYLDQPGMLGPGAVNQASGQSALLAAAIRLASDLPGDTTLAARVNDAIARRVVS
jgi:hypothetical protein